MLKFYFNISFFIWTQNRYIYIYIYIYNICLIINKGNITLVARGHYFQLEGLELKPNRPHSFYFVGCLVCGSIYRLNFGIFWSNFSINWENIKWKIPKIVETEFKWLSTPNFLFSPTKTVKFSQNFPNLLPCFLHEDLEEEIYMEAPLGFNENYNINPMYRLKKTNGLS